MTMAEDVAREFAERWLMNNCTRCEKSTGATLEFIPDLATLLTTFSERVRGEAKPFANCVWDFQLGESEFRSRLEEAGFHDYDHFSYDYYDCSIEVHKAGDDVRLTPEQQRVFFDANFAIAYVNHEDKWETHYNWKHGEPFKAQRGWRRFRTEKGFLISYWPEGWGDPNTGKNAEWLKGGYMTIVPDAPSPTTEPTRTITESENG